MQAANVGLWHWDMQVNRVYFSREWKLPLGFADDEIGDSFDEWDRRLHPDDREWARAPGHSPISADLSTRKMRSFPGKIPVSGVCNFRYTTCE